jgi:hypothetical protein
LVAFCNLKTYEYDDKTLLTEQQLTFTLTGAMPPKPGMVYCPSSSAIACRAICIEDTMQNALPLLMPSFTGIR